MEINKIAGAILTAGIAFSALGIIADNLSDPQPLKQSVLKIKGVEAAPAAPKPPAAAPLPPIAPLLVKAVPEEGRAYTRKICIACHNFNEGGKNKVGPLLYGVVGRDKASFPGFTYSAALKGKGGKWTYADLNEWLYKPSAYAPGTKMAYAGLSNDQTRANVIAYLRTLSPHPEPLPEGGATPAAAKAPLAPAAAATAAKAIAKPAAALPAKPAASHAAPASAPIPAAPKLPPTEGAPAKAATPAPAQFAPAQAPAAATSTPATAAPVTKPATPPSAAAPSKPAPSSPAAPPSAAAPRPAASAPAPAANAHALTPPGEGGPKPADASAPPKPADQPKPPAPPASAPAKTDQGAPH